MLSESEVQQDLVEEDQVHVVHQHLPLALSEVEIGVRAAGSYLIEDFGELV
jgi:hypothetical protein